MKCLEHFQKGLEHFSILFAHNPCKVGSAEREIGHPLIFMVEKPLEWRGLFSPHRILSFLLFWWHIFMFKGDIVLQINTQITNAKLSS